MPGVEVNPIPPQETAAPAGNGHEQTDNGSAGVTATAAGNHPSSDKSEPTPQQRTKAGGGSSRRGRDRRRGEKKEKKAPAGDAATAIATAAEEGGAAAVTGADTAAAKSSRKNRKEAKKEKKRRAKQDGASSASSLTLADPAATTKATGAKRDTRQWDVRCSHMSSRIENVIRGLAARAEQIQQQHAADAPDERAKPLIKLSVGDPTLDRDFFRAPTRHLDAVRNALYSNEHNGYQHTSGYMPARAAVSDFWVRNFLTKPAPAAGDKDDKGKKEKAAAYQRRVDSIPPSHVVMTSGGSHAIQLAFTALCNKGDNVLLPKPCFPHYMSMCDTYKIEKRYYSLLPDKHWEADLAEMERLVDDRTRMIVLTNPSNPCGSNFSRQHVEDILKLAEKLKLPVFSDEIYAGMVFQFESEATTAAKSNGGHSSSSDDESNNQKKEEKKEAVPQQQQQQQQRHVFTSVADVNTSVPRVILGGTAKQFAVPGWRLGWLIYAGDSSLPDNNNDNKKDKKNKNKNKKGEDKITESEKTVEKAEEKEEEKKKGTKVSKGQKYPNESGDNFLYGLEQQALLIVGPSSLPQAALPEFLASACLSLAPRPAKSPESLAAESPEERDDAFFYRYVTQIEKCARTFVDAVNEKCRAPPLPATTTGEEDKESGAGPAGRGTRESAHRHMLFAYMPQGAMYVMVKIHKKYFARGVADTDEQFFEHLVEEQGVQVVPGSAFHQPGFVRVVITRPESVLTEAVDRMAELCHAHYDPERERAHAERAAQKAAKDAARKKEAAKKRAEKKKSKATVGGAQAPPPPAPPAAAAAEAEAVVTTEGPKGTPFQEASESESGSGDKEEAAAAAIAATVSSEQHEDPQPSETD